MRARGIVVIAVFCVGLVLGGAATALARGRANDEASPEVRAVQASAPGARLAATVDAGGTLLRKRGVVGVTNPGDGTYCVTPKPNLNLDLSRVVPQATVEWGRSGGNGNLVQVYLNAADCPDGDIEVVTFSFVDGAFAPTSSVAFNLIVP